MTKNNDKIILGHGSGGKLSHDLINNLFIKHFSNSILSQQSDSAIVDINNSRIAFTTDSFVVDPIFFPGGNIGNIAVAGTINDLAVSGAIPKYLSCGFIIEEGMPFKQLEEIVISMAQDAKKAGVPIVTGDTKVVDKGKCDKVFINTSGIGDLEERNVHISLGDNILPGDKIIINGSIGDHGMAIMAARNELNINTHIESDCAPLNDLIADALSVSDNIRFMRDATRGGLGTVISELVAGSDYGIEVNQDKLTVHDNVRGLCEILGFDPLYVANEGKVVMVVASEDADNVIESMKKSPYGEEASIIGEVSYDHPGMAWLNTSVGGKRVIEMLSGQQLPRIC
ncbi:MAG: hydrogenase expression/formation protein HypE [Lentimicrobiaceae bacterium]|jgi:hydrogenase expression/formation protein HypE|nr:hydrogenase expression/formation protein HypE [Lentimicrobiaceae bacterium]MCP4909895.1 hydrogenase expression/formation protein HypE [Bacteroidota bacterium]MBT3453700.1 hydrogenase expression/formation protein HypE [Lentimicrobiaceae bacterium]MBT3818215.1 hydrogenase expression/formation protein HypE [Lentimicrobiaceae bacterium]MBT4190939.1 hydrogenase expression/formation protein HypE [Lentimicrobiaceae bacterium]